MEHSEKIPNKYMLKLKNEIITFLKDENVKIIIFGSRARGDNYPGADADIGIIPYCKFDNTKLALLNERIEGLNVPYKVDIVNLDEASESFKKEALKQMIVWKD